MPLEFSDYVVDPALYDPEKILSFWRWRVGEDAEIVLANAMGDLFLAKGDGTIWFLDSYFGELIPTADSYDHFKQKLGDPETFEDWFACGFVGDLIDSGLRRKPSECFSGVIPPTLGGAMDKSNFACCALLAHHGFYGPILQQVNPS